MNEQTNLPVPVTTPQQPPARPEALSELLERNTQEWTSFDFTDPKQRDLYFDAAENPTHEITVGKDFEFAIQHVIAEEKEWTNEQTGEVSAGSRIVLIAPDGQSYQTFSDVARQSLARIFLAYGPPPFNPPIKVKTRWIKGLKGQMLKLVPADKPAQKDAKEKGKP